MSARLENILDELNLKESDKTKIREAYIADMQEHGNNLAEMVDEYKKNVDKISNEKLEKYIDALEKQADAFKKVFCENIIKEMLNSPKFDEAEFRRKNGLCEE